ncbi:LacI family DNA-binding transcriptional regulator [Microbacterium sp.]|uniref:LacI family DNA-binding transcriptional regulator n=1 Tax=Microbacterium sp. TaxID=51671 RepID=UPI0039E28C19
MKPRRTTAQDVADLAGVSRSAVSLVLNDRADGNIAAETQQTIRAAAQRLNYTPHSIAVSLRRQRTQTIGVVTDYIASTAYGGHILSAATRAALDHGYMLLTVDTHNSEEVEEVAFQRLVDRQVDALVFAGMETHEHPVPALMRTLPSVMINSFTADADIPSVCPDERTGGRRAAELLLAAGHRDILWLGGTLDVQPARERLQGYRDAMRAAGLPAREPLVGGWEIGGAYRVAESVLASPDRPTAILAGNDRSAIGIALAATRQGLDVPRDLSIVGYDDDDHVAAVMIPPLTTMRLPHDELGRIGVRMLVDQLSGTAPQTPEQVLVDCEPIERASVAPPSS